MFQFLLSNMWDAGKKRKKGLGNFIAIGHSYLWSWFVSPKSRKQASSAVLTWWKLQLVFLLPPSVVYIAIPSIFLLLLFCKTNEMLLKELNKVSTIKALHLKEALSVWCHCTIKGSDNASCVPTQPCWHTSAKKALVFSSFQQLLELRWFVCCCSKTNRTWLHCLCAGHYQEAFPACSLLCKIQAVSLLQSSSGGRKYYLEGGGGKCGAAPPSHRVIVGPVHDRCAGHGAAAAGHGGGTGAVAQCLGGLSPMSPGLPLPVLQRHLEYVPVTTLKTKGLKMTVFRNSLR